VLEALNRLGSVEFYAIVGEKQVCVSKTSSAKQERTPKTKLARGFLNVPRSRATDNKSDTPFKQNYITNLFF
jgi:hypothetical protein